MHAAEVHSWLSLKTTREILVSLHGLVFDRPSEKGRFLYTT